MKQFSIIIACIAMTLCISGGCNAGKTGKKAQKGTQGVQEEAQETGPAPQAANTSIYNSTGRGIYWWKKDFRLSAYEKDFIEKHNIKRLYINFFDVSIEKDWNKNSEEAVPIATTRFHQLPPDGVSIIPVVYITVDVLKKYCGEESFSERTDKALAELADNICRRVLAIVSFNSLGEIKEVQFDCDWTESTEHCYYRLCHHAENFLSKNGITLSGTIRLHQLKDINYPFWRGVLMVYNTGSLMNIETRNSILDPDDVSSYVKPGKTANDFIKAREKDGMIIDIAYPDFNWASCFRDGKFLSLLRTASCEDKSVFEHIEQNRYRVIRKSMADGKEILPGDIIRLDYSSMENILKSAELIEKTYGKLRHDNIIYHLDSLNLSKFSSDEIERIYSFR